MCAHDAPRACTLSLDDNDALGRETNDGKVTVLDREPAVAAIVRDGSSAFVLEGPRGNTPHFDFVLGVRPLRFVELP